MTKFDGATGVQLGSQEEIGGALCQIEQLAMDSASYFMVKRYDWSTRPDPVVLPDV